MTGANLYLDHLLTYVPRLGDAAERFTQMGFKLSPLSSIDAMGISNQLILMSPLGAARANYIELMSPHDRGKLDATMQVVLSGPAGTRSMVLASEDIHDFHRRAVALGFPAKAPVHARREWRIPAEPSVFPEFDVVLPVTAPLRFNACRYYNLELYLRPDWRIHPNGAQRIARCFAVTDDMESLLRYARLFGQAARQEEPGRWIFPTGEIDLVVLSPTLAMRQFELEQLPGTYPAYLGYEIEVASLARLRGYLAERRIPLRMHASAVSIDPEFAFGNLIWFSESSRGAPR